MCCCLLAQVTYSPDLGEVQEYFLGSGGLINLYGSVTSEQLPGVTEAVAQVRDVAVCCVVCGVVPSRAVIITRGCVETCSLGRKGPHRRVWLNISTDM